MKLKCGAGATVFALLLGATPAMPQGMQHTSGSIKADNAYATEYGRTLPPVGFVDFCARSPGDCDKLSAGPVKLPMSQERWNYIYKINSFVNGKIAAVSDEEQFGRAEYWAYPVDAGDCEDFVLLKKRYLESLGFPASALLITVVLDENNGGHAVLTVTTNEGEFLLDNRRDEVLLWSDVDYTFLKRQSPRDPRSWVALARDKVITDGFVAGGPKK